MNATSSLTLSIGILHINYQVLINWCRYRTPGRVYTFITFQHIKISKFLNSSCSNRLSKLLSKLLLLIAICGCEKILMHKIFTDVMCVKFMSHFSMYSLLRVLRSSDMRFGTLIFFYAIYDNHGTNVGLLLEYPPPPF